MNKGHNKEYSLDFVDYMPNLLSDGVLYISMKYSVVIHLCPCGCKGKVVTPLSPDDWILKFDGEKVSLYPSIGNWNFECKSHYWIRNNKVIHALGWDEEKSKINLADFSENQHSKKAKRRWRWK